MSPMPSRRRARRSAPRSSRRCYRNLADTIVEAFWGFGASAEAIKARVTFEDRRADPARDRPQADDPAARRASRQLGMAAARGRRALRDPDRRRLPAAAPRVARRVPARSALPVRRQAHPAQGVRLRAAEPCRRAARVRADRRPDAAQAGPASTGRASCGRTPRSSSAPTRSRKFLESPGATSCR